MSSIPIHTGIWIDWSKGAILGSSLTVTDSNGRYIISGTATFIGIVASFSWSIVTYLIHQFRASNGRGDLLYHQQQVSIRNSGSPLGTAWELFQLSSAWSPTRFFCFKKRPSPISGHIRASSFTLIACALLVWGAFQVASVLSSRIANPTFEANTVLVEPTHCGIWSFDLANTTTVNARDQKILADTLAGRAYGRACYANDSSFSSTLSCNTYAVRSLPYTTTTLDGQCPFGSRKNISNQAQTFAHGPCDTEQNTGSFHMDTGLLDSHLHLGVNARKKHRIGFSMSVTCSPLTSTNRTSLSGGDLCPSGVDCSKNYTAYDFGPITPGVSNYTLLYDPSTPQDIVGFQSSAFYSTGGTTQNWQPIPELQLLDGDTSLFLFAANTVEYLQPVEDPFFLALYNDTTPAFNGYQLNPYYPYHPVSIMGCVDRYRIYNHENGRDTGLISNQNLRAAIDALGLNDVQAVTAQRLYYAFMTSSTYYSIFDSATGALKASDTIIGYLSPGLPNDQWKLEVEGWFQTSLAKIQAYLVGFAANTATLSPFGNISFPQIDVGVHTWEDQCKAQTVRSISGYQTFSFFGLLFTFIVGVLIIVLSMVLKPGVSFFRRRLCGGLGRWKGERALVADGKFQLHRMVFQDRGIGGWHDLDKDIPWCDVPTVIEVARYIKAEEEVRYDKCAAVEDKESTELLSSTDRA